MSKINWTDKQMEILINHYPKMEWKELLVLLKPFTKTQIISKACYHGIKRNNNNWTKDEIEFLKENYNKLSIKEISKKLNRTKTAIASKLNSENISYSKEWTDKEIQILKDNYSHMSNPNLAKLFKNRKPHSIQVLATKLGLKKDKFTRYDLDEVIKNLKDFAKELGRTPLYQETVSKEWSPSLMTINRCFGGYRKLCEIAELEIHYNLYNKAKNCLKDNNGDLCLSKTEQIISNFFIDNGINFKKEERYSNHIEGFNKRYRCDWLINNEIFVEYFGMMGNKKYEDKVKEKIKLLSNKNIKTIFLYEKDIINLKEIFKEYID